MVAARRRGGESGRDDRRRNDSQTARDITVGGDSRDHVTGERQFRDTRTDRCRVRLCRAERAWGADAGGCLESTAAGAVGVCIHPTTSLSHFAWAWRWRWYCPALSWRLSDRNGAALAVCQSSARATVPAVLFAGVMFWLFREHTHYGDAVQKLQLLSTRTVQTDPFVWKEPLDSLLTYEFVRLLRPWGLEPEIAVAVLSVLSGMVYVSVAIRIAALLGTRIGQQLFYVVGLLALGSTQLWFGHVENYSLVTAVALARSSAGHRLPAGPFQAVVRGVDVGARGQSASASGVPDAGTPVADRSAPLAFAVPGIVRERCDCARPHRDGLEGSRRAVAQRDREVSQEIANCSWSFRRSLARPTCGRH